MKEDMLFQEGWQCQYCSASLASQSALIRHRSICESQMAALSAFYKPISKYRPAKQWRIRQIIWVLGNRGTSIRFCTALMPFTSISKHKKWEQVYGHDKCEQLGKEFTRFLQKTHRFNVIFSLTSFLYFLYSFQLFLPVVSITFLYSSSILTFQD